MLCSWVRVQLGFLGGVALCGGRGVGGWGLNVCFPADFCYWRGNCCFGVWGAGRWLVIP